MVHGRSVRVHRHWKCNHSTGSWRLSRFSLFDFSLSNSDFLIETKKSTITFSPFSDSKGLSSGLFWTFPTHLRHSQTFKLRRGEGKIWKSGFYKLIWYYLDTFDFYFSRLFESRNAVFFSHSFWFFEILSTISPEALPNWVSKCWWRNKIWKLVDAETLLLLSVICSIWPKLKFNPSLRCPVL